MNLLCTGRLARNPYLIRTFQLEIYSGEELCYYLYHNPIMVDEDFLNPELLKFIEKELELPETAERLSRFLPAKDKTVQLMAIQREFGYYPEPVLRDYQKTLELQAKKLPFLRELDKADLYLAKGQYQTAINLCMNLFGREKRLAGGNERTYAKLYRIMAYAYAGLGLFDTALLCTEEAFKQAQETETVRLAWNLTKLAGNPDFADWIVASSDHFEEWEDAYIKNQTRVLSHIGNGEFGKLTTLDSIRKKETLQAMLKEKKETYRRGNDSERTE